MLKLDYFLIKTQIFYILKLLVVTILKNSKTKRGKTDTVVIIQKV